MVGPGSLYSKVHDLSVWLHAVDTNPSFQVDRLAYPYGWGKRNYSGRNLIEQSGINEGFNAHMALYPKERTNISTPSYSATFSPDSSTGSRRIWRQLFSVVKSRSLQRLRAPVSAKELREYAGTYRTKSIPVPQNLIVRDGQLYTQWGSYPFLRMLTPTGKNEFFFRYEYAKVRFERDSKGSIVKMVWQWPEGELLAFTPVEPR